MEDGGGLEVSPDGASQLQQESSEITVQESSSTQISQQTVVQSSQVVEQSSVTVQSVTESSEATFEQSTEQTQQIQGNSAVEESMAVQEASVAIEEAQRTESELEVPHEVAQPQSQVQLPQPQEAQIIMPDVENTKPVAFDETVKDSDWHTWRPRGKYEIPKVEVRFGDLNTEQLPDIKMKEAPKPTPQPVQQQEEAKPEPVEMIDQYAPQPQMMNGDLNSPNLDIPMGIPLLARVLPREGDGPKESIPLERLFTPATDSGEITPKKKKAFSNSAFYAPNHPTIQDQVNLAQKISWSLIDDNNKMSRGQSMYIKRKKRSDKWIHEGEAGVMYEADNGADEYSSPPMERNPKVVRPTLNVRSSAVSEHSEIQHSLQQVTVAGQPLHSPEVKFKNASNELQSPTGKGAELFAKRKKRMDQFIVDETTVQKSSFSSHEESSMTTQIESFNQQSIETSQEMTEQQTISSGAQYLRSTCTAVQPTIDSTVHGSAEGPDNLPDLTKILNKPSKPVCQNPSNKSNPTKKPYFTPEPRLTKQFQNQINRQNSVNSCQKPFTQSRSDVSPRPMIDSTKKLSPFTSKSFPKNNFEGNSSVCANVNKFKSKILPDKPILFSNDKSNNILPNTQFISKLSEESDQKQTETFERSNIKQNNITTKNSEPPTNLTPTINHSPMFSPTNIENIHINNPLPELKPGSPPVFLNYDGCMEQTEKSNEMSDERKDLVENNGIQEEDMLNNTGCVDSSVMHQPMTNNNLPACPFLKPSDLTLSACNNLESMAKEEKQPRDIIPETVRSTPSPRPVRPNSLPLIPLSSLVDISKSKSNDPDSCLPSVMQPVIDIQTSFSLAPASKSRLKAVIENVSPPSEESSNVAFINMNANGSWYENNQLNDFVNPQLEPSCESPLDELNCNVIASSTNFADSNNSKHISSISSPINGSTNISEDTIKQISSMHYAYNVTEGRDEGLNYSTIEANKLYKKENELIRRGFDTSREDDRNMYNMENDIIINVIEDGDSDKQPTIDQSVQNSFKTFITEDKYASLNDIEADMTHDCMPLCNDDDLDSYISEIERSLSRTPILVDKIHVDDLQSPEFYRSVSRNSNNNNDVEENNINNYEFKNERIKSKSRSNSNGTIKFVKTGSIKSLNDINIVESTDPYYDFDPEVRSILSQEENKTHLQEHIDQNPIKPYNTDKDTDLASSDEVSNHSENTLINNKQTNYNNSNLEENQINVLQSSKHPIISDPIHFMTMMEGSTGESKNIRDFAFTDNARAPVYTAEVKVVQRAALPPATTFEIPEGMPHHSLVEQFESVSKEEKRKSFNFAAKGWGTYSNFYTPISFATATS